MRSRVEKEKTQKNFFSFFDPKKTKQETKGVHIDRVSELWRDHPVWSRFVVAESPPGEEDGRGGVGEEEGRGGGAALRGRSEGEGEEEEMRVLRRRASGA